MDRRKFLIGAGGTVIGASALIGSGAFSRVEAQRQIDIEVAEDPDAYLGLNPLDTPNSQNFVALDENGHIYIQVDGEGDQQDTGEDMSHLGEGVNSDSFTYFDAMFEICNQGKADAMISYELPEPPSDRSDIGDDWEAPADDYDDQVVGFYYIAQEGDEDEEGTRVFVEEGQEVPLELGDCIEIGLRTVTKGVDATSDVPLISGEVVVTADSEGAGQAE